jgi:signal transduction histidine kinase/ActR/RegA family two-component response regulator
MPAEKPDVTQTILILAPAGRDAQIAVSFLRSAGIISGSCRNVPELCQRLRVEGNSIGALVLTEESLAAAAEYASLTEWIENQEPWSEIPIIFLTHPGQPTRITGQRVRVLSLRGAVTVLERPLRPATLLGAVRVALQSRWRQYQLRDLLEMQRDVGIELQRARLEAEAANRTKDHFLATLSHELRTPLNAISGWTYLMMNSPKDEALVAQGLEVLQRNTNSLIELISDLLDTSRIVAGTLTMEFKEIDLKQVVRASVETLRVQAAEKGISVTTLIEIPEAVGCTVSGDEARLQQILGNLLANSLKFTPRGGSVNVQLKKTRANATIVVKDTGKGISPQFLPHVFKRFSQGGARPGEEGGLGLGLAICKHLIELHGGSINASSAGPGRGAVIKLKLRTIASKGALSDQPPAKRALEKEYRKSDTRLKGIKVVAVDDNADARKLLEVILDGSSAETMVVRSGQEALEALRNLHPDILICDLAMPEMDGYEVLESLRRFRPELGQVPAIAFTAAARDDDRLATRRAGFRAHLAKPIEPEKLVKTILEILAPQKVPLVLD